MKGFDPRWRDVPDYIIGITKEIWEDRGTHTLHHCYTPGMIKRSPAGVVVGAQAVIAETMASLALWPDMQIYAEDVIWAGDADAGFLSSHRVVNVATHASDGIYGPATGKRVVQRVIADCACKDDAIFDEWLVFDHGAVVRQLGLHPRDAARMQIAAEGGVLRPFVPAMDLPGPYHGRGNDNAWGAAYVDLLQRVMAADFAALPCIYDRAVALDLPGGVAGRGVADADRFWLGLRAAFPSATLEIEHVIGRDDALMPPRAAVRWALHGRHDGWGAFGAPTGADVYVWGFSHAEFGPWGLRRDCVLYDEVQVWKQILLQTGG